MTVEIRKPILVAGVGLTVALWLWNSLHHSLVAVSYTHLDVYKRQKQSSTISEV